VTARRSLLVVGFTAHPMLLEYFLDIAL